MFILNSFLSGAAQQFVVNAVDLGSADGLLYRDSALTGVVDGRMGIVSFWVYVNNNVDTQYIIRIHPDGLDDGLHIKIGNNNADMKMVVKNNAAPGSRTVILNITSSAGVFTTAAGWVHALVGWDLTTLGAETSYLLINGTSDQTVNIRTGESDASYDDSNCVVGAYSPAGGTSLEGGLAELYVNFAETMDFSVSANVEKFRSSSGRPVDLGPDGSTPTGTAPAIYLRNPAATFGVNSGTGGNFTVAGTLTDVAPPP